MLSLNLIEQRMRAEVFPPFIQATGLANLDPDEDLLSVFDSLQLLRLIMQLETVFGIRIDNAELTEANVGTVHKLTDFVARKANLS